MTCTAQQLGREATQTVLEDGVLVERGTHDDLLAAEARYASLWRAQTDASGR